MKKSIVMLSLTIILNSSLLAQPNFPKQPQKAELYYKDIVNFVKTLEELSPQRDSLYVLQNLYFDNASLGLKEFIKRHHLTPELLLDAIGKAPEAYKSIRLFLKKISTLNKTYIEQLTQYKKLIPGAMFPPTYLLVGANRGIAQGSQVGQLVTITKLLDSPNRLMTFIIHELSHFQQAITMGFKQYGSIFSKQDNMLDLCLREGAAEFITSLVQNDITQASSLLIYEKQEKQLYKRFELDLSKKDKAFWLWDSLSDSETPKLLGYVMGFKICQSYYQNASNKQQAIQDILGITDAVLFKQKSAYQAH